MENLTNSSNIIKQCGSSIPTFLWLIENLRGIDIGPLSIATASAFLTLGIFIFSCYNLYITDMVAEHRHIVFRLLSLYPVYALTCCISIWAPMTQPTTDLLNTLYFASCMERFFDLIKFYFNGEDNLLAHLHQNDIQLNTPPCCCCCKCLPRPPITRRSFNIVKFGIRQYGLMTVFLVYISSIIEQEVKTGTRILVALQVIRALSTITAMYCANIYVRFSSLYLPSHKILPKFKVLQLTLFFGNIQLLILKILTATNVVPCYDHWPRDVRARWIHSCLLILEVFLLSILALFCYRNEAANHILENDKTLHISATSLNSNKTVESRVT